IQPGGQERRARQRARTARILVQPLLDNLRKVRLFHRFMPIRKLVKHQGVIISRLVLSLALAPWPVPPSRALGQGQRSEQEPQRPDAIKLTTARVPGRVVVPARYGRFVTGLSKNEFRVHENGEPQQIASFSSTEAPFNVALLIDTSRSTKNKL